MLDTVLLTQLLIQVSKKKCKNKLHKEQNRMNLSAMERNTMMQETITQNKMAYSVEEISAQTSLSKAFLRLEIKRGNLKSVRPGNSRRVIVTAAALEKYLNEGENKDEK